MSHQHTRVSSSSSSLNNKAVSTNNKREVSKQQNTKDKTTLASSSSSCSLTSVQNSLLAGYVAGFMGTLVGYPMDSAKVWIQTKQRPSNFVSSSSSSSVVMRSGTRAASSLAMPVNPMMMISTTTTTPSAITRLEHMVFLIRALYRGVYGPLVTVGLVQSLNFAIYDSTRRVLYAASHPTRAAGGSPTDYLQDDSLLHVGIASVTAGGVLAFLTSPLVMIKTKQQVQQISFAQAARQTFQGGSAGVARGFGPHFLTETAGRGIYFVAYEMAKRTWAQVEQQQEQHRQHHQQQSVSLMGRMVSAGVAGMICSTLIFPLDVLRSRLFASSEYLSAWTMSQRIYQELGVRGFFRGYGISIFRAGPVSAMVLPIYDYTLEHLNNHAFW